MNQITISRLKFNLPNMEMKQQFWVKYSKYYNTPLSQSLSVLGFYEDILDPIAFAIVVYDTLAPDAEVAIVPRGGFASIPANWFPVLLTCEFESSFLVLSFGLDVFVNTVIFTVVVFGCCYDKLWDLVMKAVPKVEGSESGQMVKWAYSSVYLSQTMRNPTKNSMKRL